ncbi:MAG: helix-turn-helix transcriptional regulator [Pyrinomonadaceae bacterium]
MLRLHSAILPEKKPYSVLEYKSRAFIFPQMSKFTGTSEQRRLQALLRQIRIDAGLKQSDLAERLGQSQSFVSKYESGERRLDLLELRQICEAVEISLSEFVNRFGGSANEGKQPVSKSAKAFLGKRAKH